MKHSVKFSMLLLAAVLFSSSIFSQKGEYKTKTVGNVTIGVKTGDHGTDRTTNTVRVLFTGDLHSCADKWPGLTAFIKQERKAAEETGCGVVTLDAGDMMFGSLYSAFSEIDAPEYRQLALAGYDAFVFGNHDFDLGLTSLAYMFYNRAVGDNSKDPATKENLFFPSNVTANIEAKNEGGDDNKNFANALKFINHQPYVILERAGMKVGVFGVLGRNAYEASMANGRIMYMDPVETAKKVIPMIQAKGADFIIALSHSGAMARENSEDARLARECPEINLIISGHDHEAIFQPFMVGNTAIVSAGANGTLLGEFDLLKTPDGVKAGPYSLKSVPEDITPDPGATILFNDLKGKVADQFGKRFHSSPFDVIDSVAAPLSMTTDENGFNPMDYDVAKAIFNAAYFLKGVQMDTSKLIAIVPAGVLRQQLPSGNITYSDVFNSLSLGRDINKNPGSPLVICFLTGSEIKKICEFNASVAFQNPDTYMTFYGLNYEYNSAMPKMFRIKNVYVHGKKIESSTLYPVVTDLYTANNISLAGEKSHGFLSLDPKDNTGKPLIDIERQCAIRGTSEGWFLDYADVSEWYAYAVYLTDKVVLPDSYPVPAGKDDRSNAPYFIWGAVVLIALIGIILSLKSMRRKKK